MKSRWFCLGAATCLLPFAWGLAQAPATLRIRVLPLGDRGVVEDLAPKDWRVSMGGRDASVISQRLPREVGMEGQNWAFVFLPVRDPEARRLAVQSVATFMSSLPTTDSALVVARTAKGLECFTPGFTARPSLWTRALDRVIEELPAQLEGNPAPAFALPASPESEKEEGMEPIQALLAGIATRKVGLKVGDATLQKRSVTEAYSVSSFAGYATTIAETLVSLGRLGEALAKGPGERHLVLFSRSEIDDLANPVWAQRASKMRHESSLNEKLQTEMMARDVTLARIALKDKLTQLGLTLHSVGGAGVNYSGAFGEASIATGGYQYRFDADLVMRLGQLLPLWATRYELEVALPPGLAQPVKIVLETARKNVKIFAPLAR